MKNIWAKFRGLKLWQQILIAVLLLGAVGNATGGSSPATPDESASPSTSATSTSTPTNSASASPTKTADPAPTETVPAIGSTVADGKFAFAVWKLDCGHSTVGSGYAKSKAQGQYCFVQLSVKNIGDEAQTVFSSEQVLLDDQGREFKTDDMAMISAGDSDLWLKEINPGNRVDGTLIYDVPKGVKLVSIELHDSMFSGGVTVDLTHKAKK